ncbi:hypothetical protein F5X99DRAFT_423093 [Biscogniauxia marginata]|nr:hypothetical protein F5X99DRAFT_423093 [Biscogniauxia marginata]
MSYDSYDSDSGSSTDYEGTNFNYPRSPAVFLPPKDYENVTEGDLDPMYSHKDPYKGYEYKPYTTTKVLFLLVNLGIAYLLYRFVLPPLPGISGAGGSGPDDDVDVPSFGSATEQFGRERGFSTKPYPLNFTAEMAPFWNAYRDILADPGYESWFDDVDAASAAIEQMWEAVSPPPPGHKNTAAYAVLQELIARRSSALAMARAEYDDFLAARARAVRSMIGSGSLWRVYVDGKFGVGGSGSRNGNANTTTTGVSAEQWREAAAHFEANFTLPAFDNQTHAALTLSARRVVDELARAHRELWKPSQVGGLEVIARAIVHIAASGERGLVPRLRAASPKGYLWGARHAAAMPALVRRMQRVRRQHDDLRGGLEWFFRRFTRELVFARGRREDLLVWVQSTAELVQKWAEVLMDTQEGVLRALRRAELAGQDATKIDYNKSWESWKSRNCGGTSCYDAQTVGNAFKRVIGAGNPLAYVAQDESKWIKDFEDKENVKVWPGVYEKACCEDGRLAQLLKHGS